MPADLFIRQYFRPPDYYFIQKKRIALMKQFNTLPYGGYRKSDIKIRPEGRAFKTSAAISAWKTIAAIHRAIVSGREQNLAGLSAGHASEHFVLISQVKYIYKRIGARVWCRLYRTVYSEF